MSSKMHAGISRWIGLFLAGVLLSACGAGVATEPKDPAGNKPPPTPTPVKLPSSTPVPSPVPVPGATPTPSPTPVQLPPPGTDTGLPSVVFVNPPDTAMGANLNAIVVTFSKALKINSVNSASFLVAGPQGLLNGTLSIKDDKIVTFKPNPSLEFGTHYDVKLTTEIQDSAGNFMGQDFVWGFNTGKQLALHSNGGHTCARLRSTGALKCWGANDLGQLGLGDTQSRGDTINEMGTKLLPVNLGIGRSVVQVVAGSGHTCARLDNLQVKCWGINTSGQLGLDSQVSKGAQLLDMGESLLAVNLGAGRYALELVAGFAHTCARLDNGRVKCWGSGLALGLGDAESRGDNPTGPTSPSEMGDALPYVVLGTNQQGKNLNAVALYAGAYHTCARLDEDAKVKCWGWNNDGQLGLGNTETHGTGPLQMGDYLPALDFGSYRFALQLSLGDAHSCAVLDNWNVKCWGLGIHGQLGLGSAASLGGSPQQMGNYLPVVNLGMNRTAPEISAGAEHTCARLDDGRTKCWGNNGAGQLGIGDANDRGTNPAEMGDILPFVNLGTDALGTPLHAVELVTGYSHSCARLDNAAIKCWGSNSSCQLGVGDTVLRGSLTSDMGNALPAVDLGGL
ncbi:MAG: Ig-like domain-containing protein [Gammaproteobacteria bacterium]|nr:Ig-like domain-containing protein [Gammaproteobacteria bacterium]